MTEPLPDLETSELDEAALDALFEDLASGAEILELRVKAAPQTRVGTHTIPLAEAHARLVARTVLGIQVRWVRGDDACMDTLLVTPTGVRLVRMHIPPDAP
ncbi:MAG: hypothetical protein KC621_10560 [Myxococcales bacterium]|nr:hypothetical protein [Myxococcales bacterium]MCB9592133.1 hypothetical protein [Sandaracinaceae bacterium]